MLARATCLNTRAQQTSRAAVSSSQRIPRRPPRTTLRMAHCVRRRARARRHGLQLPTLIPPSARRAQKVRAHRHGLRRPTGFCSRRTSHTQPHAALPRRLRRRRRQRVLWTAQSAGTLRWRAKCAPHDSPTSRQRSRLTTRPLALRGNRGSPQHDAPPSTPSPCLTGRRSTPSSSLTDGSHAAHCCCCVACAGS